MLAGISEPTYYCWLNPSDPKHPLTPKQLSEFSEAIKRAELERKKLLISKIEVASNEAWQAAAWLLERKHPEEFGRKEAAAGGDTPINPPQNKEQEELMFSLLSRLEKYRKQKPEPQPTDISLT